MLKKSGLIFFIILFNIGLYSQSLVTDRPDQTESAVTVPLNSLQIETGFAYESLEENSIPIKNYSLASTLIRYGIIDFLELRFGGAYLITEEEININGLGNLFAGIKANFLTEDINPFDFALLVHSFLPIGSSAFKPEKAEPQVIAAVSKSISEEVSLSVNLGGRYSSLFDKMTYQYSAAMGISLTNKLSTFLEAYGNFTPSVSPIHNFDTGLTYLLSDDLQLDLSGGKGISGIESFWFVSTGVSLRFNNL